MHLRWRRHWKIVGALIAVLAVLVGGVGHWRIAAVTTGGGLDRRISTTGVALRGNVALFDDTVLHEIEISYDETEYDRMIETYQQEGEKDWIQATVVIDGTRIENVGLRLKGNSSLFGVGGRSPMAGPGGPQGGFNPERAPARRPEFEFPPADGAGPPFPGRDGGAPPGAAGLPGGMPGGGASAEEPERLPWLIQEAFRGLYDAAYEELRQELFDDGTAQEILAMVDRFLNSNAANLVDRPTQSSELASLTQRLAATSPSR